MIPNDNPESPLIRFFAYQHLAPELQDVSREFSHLAHYVDIYIADTSEKSTALRLLLMAKDAAVRAML